MLFRHGAFYLLAKIGPAVISLFSITIYTRLLGSIDYGRFALVYSVAGIACGLFYAWLWLSLGRFFSLYQNRENLLLATSLWSFLGLSLFGGTITAILAVTWPDQETRSLVWLTIPLSYLIGWFEINQELNRARLNPAKYAIFSFLRSIITVAASITLAYWQFGAPAMVWGAIIGLMAPIMLIRRAGWMQALRSSLRAKVLKEMGQYGLSLSLSVFLVMVVFSADRLLLGWLLNAEMAGLYSVSYDLALKSIHTLTIAMDLAAFPIAVRALESSGVEAARRQLASNGTLLMTITFPAATGLFLLAEPIINLLLGEGFRESALQVFPWILCAALLAGLSQAHFQHAFTLGRNTKLFAVIMALVCLVNLAMNVVLIPNFGILGSAYASCTSFALLLMLSWIFGRRVFIVPVPWKNGALILCASAAMGVTLLLLDIASTPLELVGQISLGAVVYGLILLALNPDDYRSRLLEWLTHGPLTSRSGR